MADRVEIFESEGEDGIEVYAGDIPLCVCGNRFKAEFIRKAVLKSLGALEPTRPPAALWELAASAGLPAALAFLEGQLITDALERCAGNRSQAAAMLRIKRTSLIEKLKRIEANALELVR